MSLDNLLKAKQEGAERLPWKDLSKEDFKRYYVMFHNGKSKPRVKEDDLRFYDALKERKYLNYIFPVSRRLRIPLDSRMESFAKDYVNTIIPVNEIADRYYMMYLRSNTHLDRYMKKAVDLGYVKKEEYEKAVERRQFINKMGKNFSPELRDRIFEIASRGYDYIRENQDKIINEIIADFVNHERKVDKMQWIKTNKYFSNRYGKITYERPKYKNGDKICEKPFCEKSISVMISNNAKAREIQEKRKRLISQLIRFFKIIKNNKHLKGLEMGHLKGVRRKKTGKI
jgi:hypothetical protein